jgi:hypothetical protein
VRQLPRLWTLKSQIGLEQGEGSPKRVDTPMIHLSSVHVSGTPSPFTQPPQATRMSPDTNYFSTASASGSAVNVLGEHHSVM